MNILELLAIAVALSLDAFAVAAGTGCAVREVRAPQYVRMAGAFGFFQFLMPVIGWYLGTTVHRYIENWDHWIAFVLLAWVGGSMLRSAWGATMRRREGAEAEGDACALPPQGKDPTSGSNLLVLAVATSIDALAVGLSFAMLGLNIWGAALLIGCVCAAISGLGLLLGCRLARATTLGSRAELVGGLVLIGIGVNILHTHAVF